MYIFFIVENGNTVHLLTFSFSQNIQNPDCLVESKVCQKRNKWSQLENSVHGIMSELNGVTVSVVKVRSVQAFASFFDLQMDPK